MNVSAAVRRCVKIKESAALLALAAIVIGCAGSPELPPASGIVREQSAVKRRAGAASGTLFVADGLYRYRDGRIAVFQNGTYKHLYDITAGLREPLGLWVGSAGNLYAANSVTHNVTEYAPGQKVPKCTYTAGLTSPFDVISDAAGNVYVSNGSASGQASVEVFPQCKNTLARQYPINGQPVGIAFDAGGNLFVCFIASVKVHAQTKYNVHFEEFTPGRSKPTVLGVTTTNTEGIAIDKSGTLIATDVSKGTILVAPKPYTTFKTLVSGLRGYPAFVALNRSETLLFCTERGLNRVDVYSYPSVHFITSINVPVTGGVRDLPNA